MNPQHFDLIVIGGGPAGVCGANTAAIFGKRVALIEKEPILGGAGINTGTIPSKTLRETAIALSGWRSRRLYGVDLSLRREATIDDFTRHRDNVTAGERRQIDLRLDANNVTNLQGTAAFVDPHTIRVRKQDGSEVLLSGDVVLIATGSSPRRPAEFPFENDRVHDSDELLDITTIPKRLAVVGAGVIGSEYACTFASMGVEIHLIDGRDELLGFLDNEISHALEAAMRNNGIHFHWNERVSHCDVSRPDEVVLTLTSGATLVCDDVLVCAGRVSNTSELNLVAAGITVGKHGLIQVDHTYCSEAAHIYAAGDVIGPPALAATSMEQARVAMCHAFGLTLELDFSPLLPAGVYTIPETSMVGVTEEELKEQGIEYVVGRARYADNPRGRIMGDDNGFLKLIFRKSDMKLLGVHCLGEQATELVHIGLMALLSDASAEVFARACFNYPTLGDLYKQATYDALIRKSEISIEG